jgi:hypothetical protein
MPLTRRLILQKARRHPPAPKGHARLRRIVGERFQVLFHSPPGVLFTIPSRYYPLSVTREYSALPDGPGRFTANFRSSRLLENIPREAVSFHLRDFHPLRSGIHSGSANPQLCHSRQDCQLLQATSHNPANATPDRYHTHAV